MYRTLASAFNVNTEVAPINNTVRARGIQISNFAQFDLSQSNKLAILYSCKKIISETIGKLPVYTTKDGKKYTEHYVNSVLQRPNGYQTCNIFLSKVINDLQDNGNSYYRIYKENGFAKSLIPLYAPEVSYDILENGELIYIYKNVRYNSCDILHFRDSVLDINGVCGVSPVKILSKLININYQSLNVIDNYYRNGLHTNKYLQSQGGVDVKGFNQGLHQFKEEYKGSANAGELLNLPFGTEIKELKLEFADAALLDSMKETGKQIAAAFGVPTFLLNLDEMKYKSIEEALTSFKSVTIEPIIKMIKTELRSKLLSSKDIKNNISIDFNLNAMLASDSITRANYLKTLKDSAIITPNQAAFIEGFDTYEAGSYHYSQSQNQPLELICKNGEFKPVTTGKTNDTNEFNNNNYDKPSD